MNDDLISRQEAIDEMEKSKKQYFDRRVIIGKMQDIVNNLPSEPERKTGKWIDDNCSVCGHYVHHGDARNYCSNCGAKMEAGNDE